MAVAALLGVVWPLVAEVKVRTRADGSRVIYNDSSRAAGADRSSVSGSLGATELADLIRVAAQQNRLDPRLVQSVIQVESAYDPYARSHRGAMGLMQLMPDTARELNVTDPFDASQNVHAGASYLRKLMDRFQGELELALAGYNAGPEAVRRFGGIPPYRETRGYVEKVLRLYRNDPTLKLSMPRHAALGRKTFLVRRADGTILVTTTPPG